MITSSFTAPTGSANPQAVPAHARQLAARLSALFVDDQRIVRRLNDAQRHLGTANERLWSGLAPDASGLIYDGAAPAGSSQIARLVGPGASGWQIALLAALQDAHWTIHRAFCEYQSGCEQRRQLAFEVGELAQQLTDALIHAGWSRTEAQTADVHQLARWEPGR